MTVDAQYNSGSRLLHALGEPARDAFLLLAFEPFSTARLPAFFLVFLSFAKTVRQAGQATFG
eukprot:m.63280 g.63280  ORF g.63280 m.63280 type:complete len:62 (+) comp13965_c0_seq1:249-434(+)